MAEYEQAACEADVVQEHCSFQGGSSDFLSTMEPSVEGPRAAVVNASLEDVREHLAAVAQELEALQRHCDQESKDTGADLGTALEAVNAAAAAVSGDGTTTQFSGDVVNLLADMHRKLKHMEVDREAALARARRLEAENAALVDSHARMEAEFRSLRQRLEEARRRIRHQEIDIQRYRAGEPVPSIMDGSPSGEQDALSSKALNEQAQLGEAGIKRLGPQVPKQQLIAALGAAQTRVIDEQKKLRSVEKRAEKEREKLSAISELADRQRMEITRWQQQAKDKEDYAKQCERRLKKCFVQANQLNMTLRVGREDSSEGRFGGSQPLRSTSNGGATMVRNHSAPTFLPSVAGNRGT
eukprot:TRINITY_DN18229_c0_g1_i1.p1 TRINITY_DN18229_c0_g1~~TRINITY_DN18229_c0_g1_i1.p1  ORF type:complete len:354 (-),score=102.23 TRINITY_DN18229_c0_g1_i1:552-1613(-)